MHNILALIKKDFYNILHHRSIWITLLAFALIPMVYAVLNIQISWNPYSPASTSRLEIAVVNNDEGTSLKGKSFNIGNRIIKQLHKNHVIHWVFTDDWAANNGLENGKYYAMIEIPNDFSSRLTTYTTSDPQKPNVIYKSNEKLNPAATKITGQAKNTLTDTIRQNFIKTGSKEALQKANIIGARLNTKKPEILQIRDSLTDTVKTINKTQNTLVDINKTNLKTKTALRDVKSNIPVISSQIDNLQNVISNTNSLNNSTQKLNSSLKSSLADGINSSQTRAKKLQNTLYALPSGTVSTMTLDSSSATTISLLNSINDTLNDNLRVLDIVNNLIPNNTTTSLITSISRAKQNVNKQKKLVKKLKIADSSSKQQLLIKKLKKKTNTLNTNLDNAYTTFNNTTSPALDSMNNTLNTNLTGNSQIISSMKSILPELKNLVNAGSITTSQTNNINSQLNRIKTKLKTLDKQMSFLNEKNFNKLIKILSTDSSLSSILSAPIKLQTKEIYPMKNFGWQMTPFYVVLALWIGSLLLATIIAWKYILPDTKNGLHRPNVFESYIGKLTLYLTMGFFQSTFAYIGVILLGVRPTHWFLFLLAFYVVSLTFTIMMFNLVFMLGNGGKVVIVLLMLIQLFGTGGVYPMEVVPKDLTALSSFMPFTYSIQLFREVMTTPNWSTIWHDVLILLIFILSFTAMMLLRRVFETSVFRMEEDMRKAKL